MPDLERPAENSEHTDDALLNALLQTQIPKKGTWTLPKAVSLRPVRGSQSIGTGDDWVNTWIWRAALATGSAGLLLITFWLLNGPVYDFFFAKPPAVPLHRTQIAISTSAQNERQLDNSALIEATQFIEPPTTNTPVQVREPSQRSLDNSAMIEATQFIEPPTTNTPVQVRELAQGQARTVEPLAPPTITLAQSLSLAATVEPTVEPLLSDEVSMPIWISIPSIQVDSPVIYVWVQDDNWLPIDYAAGYIRGTGDLGQQGNVVIAGHAGLRGGVFAGLPRLKPGDEIFLETPYLRFRYVVRDQRIVWPNQVEVFYATPTSTVTLIACANWDTQRLVVTGDFVDVAPIGFGGG